MYPLGMTRPLAVAVALAAVASPSAAHAATLTTNPAKPCYRSDETVNFVGSQFAPSSSVNLTRDGAFVSPIPTDAAGQFDAALRLQQDSGSQTRTYTATDSANTGLSASVPVTVSAVGVRLTPQTGNVSRRFRIRARGFTTGRTLWVHLVHRRSQRHIKIGRLRGACHTLRDAAAAAVAEGPLRKAPDPVRHLPEVQGEPPGQGRLQHQGRAQRALVRSASTRSGNAWWPSPWS